MAVRWPPPARGECMRSGAERLVGSYLQYFSLFAWCHRLLWTAKRSPPACFHLYKDQILPIFGHQINFAMEAAKIMLQYTISLMFQSVRRESFTHPAQALACRFYFLVRNNMVLY